MFISAELVINLKYRIKNHKIFDIRYLPYKTGENITIVQPLENIYIYFIIINFIIVFPTNNETFIASLIKIYKIHLNVDIENLAVSKGEFIDSYSERQHPKPR